MHEDDADVFSGKRYYQVRTQTYYGGGWHDVDRIRLVHDFVDNGEDHDNDGNLDEVLFLRYIDRQGNGPTDDIDVPAIRFDGCGTHGCALLPNRADSNPAGGVLDLKQWRVNRIRTDTGAEIQVSYGQPRGCSPIPTTWDNNVKDCFPKIWDPPDSPSGFAAWHKYVATSIRTKDLVGQSPDMLTTYSYSGNPAWHYDDSSMTTPAEGLTTWSQWRGYQKVIVTEGTAATTTRTEYTMFRGMDGDRLTNGSTKTASVTAGDGTSYTDSNWLAGRTLDVRNLPSSDTAAIRGTKTQYETRITAGSGADAARWVAPSIVEERFNEGGARTRRTTTTYNTNRMPAVVAEHGWTDTTTDDRCIKTNYAEDAARWMFSYLSHRLVRPGTTCAIGITPLRDERYFYDGSDTHHELPGAGNVTRTQTGTEVRSLTQYDALGRPVSVTDGRGHATSTSYSPASSSSSAVHVNSITTTNHLGHATTTDYHDQFIGTPTRVVDANGNVITLVYDALARLIDVWLPTEQPPSSHPTPSLEFGYSLNEHPQGYGLAGPAWTLSATLQEAGPAPSVAYGFATYDGLFRQRQQGQFATEPSGSVISQTRYDSRGLIVAETMPQYSGGWPMDLASPFTWENETVYAHDAYQRVTSATFKADGATRWSTTSSYTYNTATVSPPVGGDTRTTTDGHGQNVTVEEHDGTAWRAANYAYDPAGDLTSITDPAGNLIEYDYDLDGRRTDMNDPDAGTWSYEYDATGNQTVIVDADSETPDIHNVYDELNRPTARYAGPPLGGTLLASWTYDATGEKGLPDRSTRHDPTYGDFVVDVTGYDPRSRPLGRTWTIPAGAGDLAGSHTITYGYDAADHQTTVNYPAIGGLPAESVTTEFAPNTGKPLNLLGADPYLSEITFDTWGRVATRTLGDVADPNRVVRTYIHDEDQRLRQMVAQRADGTVLQQDIRAYDANGNVVSIEHAAPTGPHKECFTYDDRNRLKTAYTTTSTYTCASGTAPAGLGPDPYDHSYDYSVDSRLTLRREGSTTHTYAYGAAQPHAVRTISGNTNDCDFGTGGNQNYCYDENGQMTARPDSDGTGNQTMVWDDESRLSEVVDSAGTSSFVYDPDGQRILRATPDDATFYLEGHELELVDDGTTVTAKRYYSQAGTTVAVRDSAGGGSLNYLLGDHLGSTTLSVSAATGATVEQRYLPYGAPRSTSGGTEVTDRGWIGQTKDASTGLQYLNARYYDPAIGRFTAIDPIVDTAQPGSLDRYGYGYDNPATLSDPTGLWVPIGNGGARTSGKVLNNKIISTPVPVRFGPRPDPVAKQAVADRRHETRVAEFTLKGNFNFIPRTGGHLGLGRDAFQFEMADSAYPEEFSEFDNYVLFGFERKGRRLLGAITQMWKDGNTGYIYHARQQGHLVEEDISLITDPASGGGLGALSRRAPAIAAKADYADGLIAAAGVQPSEALRFEASGPMVVRRLPPTRVRTASLESPLDLFTWPDPQVVHIKEPAG